MVTDYDEQLGYDADHDDPSQYCRHGTWIGSWWGPDYLCYYCETGEEPPTPFQRDSRTIQRRIREAKDDLAMHDMVTKALNDNMPFNASTCAIWVDTTLNSDSWEKARWLYYRQEAIR